MKYKPQQAQSYPVDKKLSSLSKDFILEPKFDGARLLAETYHECGANGVEFYTRTDHQHSLPTIEAELNSIFPTDSVIDGELVCFNEKDGNICDWGTVQSVLGSSVPGDHPLEPTLVFVIFDVLAIGGTDARRLPLSDRRKLLEQALAGSDLDTVVLSPQMEATDANHEALVARGFEGSMAKDVKSPYASGKRGYGWWKIKATDDIDAVVIGFEEGKNSFTGMIGALVFGQYDKNGNMVERGKCSGFDLKTRKAISADRESYRGQVITVRHMGAMASGKFRHPQWIRWRKDKSAEEVTLHDR